MTPRGRCSSCLPFISLLSCVYFVCCIIIIILHISFLYVDAMTMLSALSYFASCSMFIFYCIALCHPCLLHAMPIIVILYFAILCCCIMVIIVALCFLSYCIPHAHHVHCASHLVVMGVCITPCHLSLKPCLCIITSFSLSCFCK